MYFVALAVPYKKNGELTAKSNGINMEVKKIPYLESLVRLEVEFVELRVDGDSVHDKTRRQVRVDSSTGRRRREDL